MTKNKKTLISIYGQLGGDAAVSSDDGDVLFSLIDKAFKEHGQVVLDFKNIELITTNFLNAAIGQLYNSYDSEFLNANFKIENLNPGDITKLRIVIQRAKEYFKNKEEMDKIVKDNLGDDN